MGYNEKNKANFNFEKENTVDHSENKVLNNVEDYDLLISFGYRHIISKENLQKCKRPPVNLHISYLPYNRGVHPNFWAWYENTTHGVTIHHIDENVDTGNIISQEKVFFKTQILLSDSYDILIERIEKLFLKNYNKILHFNYKTKQQFGKSSFHKLNDLPLWKGGWSQTINDIKIQLEGITNNGYLIRTPSSKDSKDIFNWRNDPFTRSMSFQKEMVDWESHIIWYRNTLSNPNRVWFIGEKQNNKIGVVRFDLDFEMSVANVNINLNPSWRGKGLSSSLLKSCINCFPVLKTNINIFEASIKHDNIASVRCFEKLNFVLKEVKLDSKLYVLKIKK